MLKIFTIKFENGIESFNEGLLSNFLSGKEVIKWESHFLTHRNEHYWTVIVEYASMLSSSAMRSYGKDRQRDKYKELLSENDWPLFNRLRGWRAETGKKEGVPPYIVFTNEQLARISATRPASLNALQQIQGIGNSKREKYGNDILQIIKEMELPLETANVEEQHG